MLDEKLEFAANTICNETEENKYHFEKLAPINSYANLHVNIILA